MATLRRFIIAAAVSLQAACATMGHDIDLARADELQVGASSFEDARRLFGEPAAVAEGPHGGHAYVWSYGHANTLSGRFEGKRLTLVFANTGKLLTKTRSATGAAID